MSDLISRADAIEAVRNICNTPCNEYFVEALSALPSADITDTEECQKCQETTDRILLNKASTDAVQGYTEWLEKIIVEAETFEWLCEEATDEEWCEKNCNYASIQAECLRHLYEVSKGGDDE